MSGAGILTQTLRTRDIDDLIAAGQDPMHSAESVPVSADYFKVGTSVQLTVNQKSQVASAYSVLLGYRAGRFLLVELPSVDGRALVVTPESQVRVRYLLDGRLLGFSCSSIRVQFSPEKLMFLTYPKRVDQLALRRHERVRVSLPTLVRVGDDPDQHTVETRDVSLSGCGIVFGPEVGTVDRETKLTLYFKTPQDQTLYKARAWVRTVKARRDGSFWVGCEFEFRPGEEETQTMIQRLVLSRTGMLSTSDLDPAA